MPPDRTGTRLILPARHPQCSARNHWGHQSLPILGRITAPVVGQLRPPPCPQHAQWSDYRGNSRYARQGRISGENLVALLPGADFLSRSGRASRSSSPATWVPAAETGRGADVHGGLEKAGGRCPLAPDPGAPLHLARRDSHRDTPERGVTGSVRSHPSCSPPAAPRCMDPRRRRRPGSADWG